VRVPARKKALPTGLGKYGLPGSRKPSYPVTIESAKTSTDAATSAQGARERRNGHEDDMRSTGRFARALASRHERASRSGSTATIVKTGVTMKRVAGFSA
jgi:hypothetical protein